MKQGVLDRWKFYVNSAVLGYKASSGHDGNQAKRAIQEAIGAGIPVDSLGVEKQILDKILGA